MHCLVLGAFWNFGTSLYNCFTFEFLSGWTISVMWMLPSSVVTMAWSLASVLLCFCQIRTCWSHLERGNLYWDALGYLGETQIMEAWLVRFQGGIMTYQGNLCGIFKLRICSSWSDGVKESAMINKRSLKWHFCFIGSVNAGWLNYHLWIIKDKHFLRWNLLWSVSSRFTHRSSGSEGI